MLRAEELKFILDKQNEQFKNFPILINTTRLETPKGFIWIGDGKAIQSKFKTKFFKLIKEQSLEIQELLKDKIYKEKDLIKLVEFLRKDKDPLSLYGVSVYFYIERIKEGYRPLYKMGFILNEGVCDDIEKVQVKEARPIKQLLKGLHRGKTRTAEEILLETLGADLIDFIDE